MKKILISLSLLALTSCASEAPVTMTSATSIDVIDATFAQNVVSLNNCHLKGQVLANTIDRFKPTSTVITEIEMKEIKEKAMYLGANSVVIRHNQVVYNKGMYVHVLVADAYACFAPTHQLVQEHFGETR